MSILVGTSGWNYPGGKGTWNGVFYPSRRPRGFDELAYYADHFDTVEVNSTFYRVLEPAMSLGWIRRTPPEFTFAIKLFQKFTHPDMYLKRPGVADWDVSRADIDLFRAGLEPLANANRLVALLMQFPPSFHADPDTRAYLEWLLEAFKDFPTAVELRHRTWSEATDETVALLDSHQASWALIDEPKFQSSVRQRALHRGRVSYIRLHGRNAAQWWEHDEAEDRYNYLYSPTELLPFSAAAREASADSKRVVMYLNNHFSAKAVANAVILKKQLDQPIPGDYPVEIVREYPDLDGIVRTAGLPL